MFEIIPKLFIITSFLNENQNSYGRTFNAKVINYLATGMNWVDIKSLTHIETDWWLSSGGVGFPTRDATNNEYYMPVCYGRLINNSYQWYVGKPSSTFSVDSFNQLNERGYHYFYIAIS